MPCLTVRRAGVCQALVVLSFMLAVHISYTSHRQSYVQRRPFSPTQVVSPTHHSPKNSAMQRAMQPLLINQMLRHIMQAYKPKQAMCEAMLLCVRSTLTMTFMSTFLLLLRYSFCCLIFGRFSRVSVQCANASSGMPSPSSAFATI